MRKRPLRANSKARSITGVLFTIQTPLLREDNAVQAPGFLCVAFAALVTLAAFLRRNIREEPALCFRQQGERDAGPQPSSGE